MESRRWLGSSSAPHEQTAAKRLHHSLFIVCFYQLPSVSHSWVRCERGMMGDGGLSAWGRAGPRSVVQFPRVLISEPPLRKHTCRQPMRRCPATHTGPAHTNQRSQLLIWFVKPSQDEHGGESESGRASHPALLPLGHNLN